MQPALAIVAVIAVALGALLIRTLFRRKEPPAFDPLEWLENCSAGDYTPMGRLLDRRDEDFLARQRGFTPAIARRLHRQRIGIFQAYVRSTVRDFHRLQKIARVAVVWSTDEPEKVRETSWRRRMGFYLSVAAVEMRLALSAAGLARVDSRGMLAALERMRAYTAARVAQAVLAN